MLATHQPALTVCHFLLLLQLHLTYLIHQFHSICQIQNALVSGFRYYDHSYARETISMFSQFPELTSYRYSNIILEAVWGPIKCLGGFNKLSVRNVWFYFGDQSYLVFLFKLHLFYEVTNIYLNDLEHARVALVSDCRIYDVKLSDERG